MTLAANSPDSLLARRDHALVELLYSSGLRLSELTSLDWRHFAAQGGQPASVSWVDLEGAEATVRGKGSKTRTVPIGAPAIEALRRWLAVRSAITACDERALFVSTRGERLAPRSVQARLGQLARRLGLGVHVHPHMLRHSFASHLLSRARPARRPGTARARGHLDDADLYPP